MRYQLPRVAPPNSKIATPSPTGIFIVSYRRDDAYGPPRRLVHAEHEILIFLYFKTGGLDFTLEEKARITVIGEELRTVLESAKKRQQKPSQRKLRSTLVPNLNKTQVRQFAIPYGHRPGYPEWLEQEPA